MKQLRKKLHSDIFIPFQCKYVKSQTGSPGSEYKRFRGYEYIEKYNALAHSLILVQVIEYPQCASCPLYTSFKCEQGMISNGGKWRLQKLCSFPE